MNIDPCESPLNGAGGLPALEQVTVPNPATAAIHGLKTVSPLNVENGWFKPEEAVVPW